MIEDLLYACNCNEITCNISASTNFFNVEIYFQIIKDF